MANCIMGFPNYVDSTFNDVVFTGGNWQLPLDNLRNARLSLPAKAADNTNASTWFEVDMGGLRDVQLGSIPSSNSTLSGQYRLKMTSTPAFSNSTVVGLSASSGASSVTFKAPGTVDIDVTAGDFFTIGGFLYKSDTTTTITAGNTGVISLASASGNDIHNATLQADISVDDSIRCNTGDYTTPLYDSTQKDIFQTIYPFQSLPWQHPSYWNGKATEEERQTLVFPIVDVLTDSSVIAIYAKYEFFDENNSDPFAISRVFLTPGWQPSINPIYGAEFSYKTDTTFDKSYGGEKTYDVKQAYRVLGFTIDNLPQNEALTQALEMQRKQGIDKQIFFIFDPEDTDNMHRRAFTCTMSDLDALSYAYYNHMAFSAQLEEVVGGILV